MCNNLYGKVEAKEENKNVFIILKKYAFASFVKYTNLLIIKKIFQLKIINSII